MRTRKIAYPVRTTYVVAQAFGIFNMTAGTTLTLATPISSAPTPGGNIIAGLFIKDNSATLLLTSHDKAPDNDVGYP